MKKRRILEWIYEKLFDHYGSMGWWPAKDPFEVAVGAILTQNTAWVNVERAIKNLGENGLLCPKAIFEASEEEISRLIRPAGYYRIKAKRLKEFIKFLFSKYRGEMSRMFERDPLVLRKELLGINGIGLETADSILLYAGGVPIFVVDAYTRRILSRHNLIDKGATYPEIQNLFMDNLPHDTQLYNEFHALLVQLGKEVCRKVPRCGVCPIKELNKIMEGRCDGCGKKIGQGDLRYILKLELYCAPDIQIPEEELMKDHRKEMERLIERMKGMEKRELEEEVYMKERLVVCKRCRDAIRWRILSKEFV
jgi:endonuclease-3 related protein